MIQFYFTTFTFIFYACKNSNNYIISIDQNIGAHVDVPSIMTEEDLLPPLPNTLLTPEGTNKFYCIGIEEVSSKCFSKAVTIPLQQQNEAISKFVGAEKKAASLKRKRDPSLILTNPSTTIGLVVDMDVITALRVTHTNKVDKKQREEDAGKNKLVKKGTDAFLNDQILTNFKLTYPTCGLWRDFSMDKIKPLAKCCGVSVSLNKQPMILAINAKMNSLLNINLP